MPVSLLPEHEPLRLDPDQQRQSAVPGCLQPHREELTEAIRVSTLVSSVRNRGPELIEPLDESEGS
jgi:putative SOS response-associated peptidase YedK